MNLEEQTKKIENQLNTEGIGIIKFERILT